MGNAQNQNSLKSYDEILNKISTRATKETLENEKVEWLIDGLIAKNTINMFYGKAGVGKSHLLLAMVLYISKCESIKKIYYLDSDNGKITISDRGVGDIETSKIDYRYDFKAPDKYSIFDMFLNETDSLDGALICVDTIGNFTNFDIRDDSLVGSFMDKLMRLRDQKGASIIFLHHQPKQYDGENNKAYKGSTRFEDSSNESIFVGKAISLSGNEIKDKIIFDLEPQKHRIATKEIIRVIVDVKDNHSLEISDDIYAGLNEKQTITMELQEEVLSANPQGINQSKLGFEIKNLAKKYHYEIVGDNAMWNLFRKYQGYKYTITKQPKANGGFEAIYQLKQ